MPAFSSAEFRALFDEADALTAEIASSSERARRSLYRDRLILRGKTRSLEALEQRLADERFLRRILNEHGLSGVVLPLQMNIAVDPGDLLDRDGSSFPESRFAPFDPDLGGITLPILVQQSGLRSEQRRMARILRTFVSLEHRTQALGAEDPSEIIDASSLPYVLETTSIEPVMTEYGSGVVLELLAVLEAPAWVNTFRIAPFAPEGLEILDLWVETDGGTVHLIDSPEVFDTEKVIRFDTMLVRRAGIKLIQRTAQMKREVVSSPFYTIKSRLPWDDEPSSLEGASQMVLAYQYGLSEFDLSFISYDLSGVWVSDALSFARPVRGVSLVVEEAGDGYFEYSVSPRSGLWVPIVPLGQEKLREVLFFEADEAGILKATLRFRPVAEPEIYENGKLLPKSRVTFNDEDCSIRVSDQSLAATYEAVYQVGREAQVVDFWERLGEDAVQWIEETFTLSQTSASIELRSFPFVDRGRLYLQGDDWDPSIVSDPANANHYSPMNIQVLDASTGQAWIQPPHPGYTGQAIWNRTDYLGKGVTFTGEGLEYRLQGRTVHFSQPIPAGSQVTVRYPILVEGVRVRLVMRKSPFHDGTPVLKRIAIVPYGLGVSSVE